MKIEVTKTSKEMVDFPLPIYRRIGDISFVRIGDENAILVKVDNPEFPFENSINVYPAGAHGYDSIVSVWALSQDECNEDDFNSAFHRALETLNQIQIPQLA
jgi:hypothetical protein